MKISALQIILGVMHSLFLDAYHAAMRSDVMSSAAVRTRRPCIQLSSRVTGMKPLYALLAINYLTFRITD